MIFGQVCLSRICFYMFFICFYTFLYAFMGFLYVFICFLYVFIRFYMVFICFYTFFIRFYMFLYQSCSGELLVEVVTPQWWVRLPLVPFTLWILSLEMRNQIGVSEGQLRQQKRISYSKSWDNRSSLKNRVFRIFSRVF